MFTKKLNRIIISRTDSIGDVMLTLPLLGILKSRFPDSKIIFLGRNYTRPILDCCKYADEFADWGEVEESGISGQIAFLRSLKADCIIHVFPKKKIALASRKAKIPLRIGTSHRIYHWVNCNKLVNFTRKNSSLHESQLNLKLLLPLDLDNIPSLKEMEKYFGFQKIKPSNYKDWIDSNRFNLILHPKSKGSAREWGLKNFSKLIELLPEEKFKIFISGTKEEGEMMQDFFIKNPKVLNITGKLSLPDFISFINECDGLIAASTGPLHIAAVLGKVAIGIYSPMRPIHPGRWSPIGNKAVCFVKNIQCIDCKKSKICHCVTSIAPIEIADFLKKEIR